MLFMEQMEPLYKPGSGHHISDSVGFVIEMPLNINIIYYFSFTHNVSKKVL
jgi:hypothetical protein